MFVVFILEFPPPPFKDHAISLWPRSTKAVAIAAILMFLICKLLADQYTDQLDDRLTDFSQQQSSLHIAGIVNIYLASALCKPLAVATAEVCLGHSAVLQHLIRCRKEIFI